MSGITLGLPELLVLLTLGTIIFPAGIYVGRLAQKQESQNERLSALERRFDTHVKEIYREIKLIRKELISAVDEDEDDVS